MNLVVMIGNLARDPEVRYGQNNLAIAKFTIAVNRPPRSGEDAGADFIRVTAFGKQAELVERYLTKGRKVAIEGRIQTGSYEKDGQKIYTTDVIANRVEFISSRNDGGGSGGGSFGDGDYGSGGSQNGNLGGGSFANNNTDNISAAPLQDVPSSFAEMDDDDDLPF
jgi:single-strand DNA-binding protein